MTRREEAGSFTLPPPQKPRASADANALKEVVDCGGNVLLMEARLCEITSSIRALMRSNQDLNDALESDAPNDPDFLQAVEENKLAMRRQGRVAVALVNEMKAHGCNVELEEDIDRAIFGSNTIAVVDMVAATNAANENSNQNSDATGNTSANAAAHPESPQMGGTSAGGVFL